MGITEAIDRELPDQDAGQDTDQDAWEAQSWPEAQIRYQIMGAQN
jgi:hypothetical protein